MLAWLFLLLSQLICPSLAIFNYLRKKRKCCQTFHQKILPSQGKCLIRKRKYCQILMTWWSINTRLKLGSSLSAKKDFPSYRCIYSQYVIETIMTSSTGKRPIIRNVIMQIRDASSSGCLYSLPVMF